jgi:periplasmic mercuric ion binding protein
MRIAILMLMTLLAARVSAETIEMKVNGLVCGFCAQGIEKTLRKNPATADVVVSLEEHLVAVATRDGQDIPDSVLREALTSSGYDIKTISRSDTPIGVIRARVIGHEK